MKEDLLPVMLVMDDGRESLLGDRKFTINTIIAIPVHYGGGFGQAQFKMAGMCIRDEKTYYVWEQI
jgi:hypothetical protein